MTNAPDRRQGKLDVGVNSYCINITGNWQDCSKCHAGLGLRPETVMSREQLENIDCLICHQQNYKRKSVAGVYVPDTDNMSISMVAAARTVHRPNRVTCLQCHAKGGGGDNFKRGDLALAHNNTTDRNFDVHMATTAGNLNCQACHATEQHRIAGKGSDLRPTDLDVSMECSGCHTGKDGLFGHLDPAVGRHVARVACQTCHIPAYARNASDTAASEQTETHRDWTQSLALPNGRFEPTFTMEGNLTPEYKWWNGFSSNYLLFDQAILDPQTNRYPTSRPEGAVDGTGSKLFPFKYKTALQPLARVQNELIALDTSVYFAGGDHVAASAQGLVNMGYNATDGVDYVETDTYQLITHEVAPASQVLACADCHDSMSTQITPQMDLQGALGYELKGPTDNVPNSLCTQCHAHENLVNFSFLHSLHVKFERRECASCHNFSRPERNLIPAPPYPAP